MFIRRSHNLLGARAQLLRRAVSLNVEYTYLFSRKCYSTTPLNDPSTQDENKTTGNTINNDESLSSKSQIVDVDSLINNREMLLSEQRIKNPIENIDINTDQPGSSPELSHEDKLKNDIKEMMDNEFNLPWESQSSLDDEKETGRFASNWQEESDLNQDRNTSANSEGDSNEFPVSWDDTFGESEVKLPWEMDSLDSNSDLSWNTKGSSNVKLPWETDDGEDSVFELPWEGAGKSSSDQHLILNPLKRKHSPLEMVEKNISSFIPQKINAKASSHNFNMVDFERDVKSLMVFKKNLNDEELLRIIDEVKPEKSFVSTKRYNQLVADLKGPYTIKQLTEYAKNRGVVKIPKTIKKAKLIDLILKKCWELEINDSAVDASDELNVEIRIQLQNRRELFMLFSHKGYIARSWSALGAKLSLSGDNDALVVRGNPSIVDFVQTSWNQILNTLHSSMVDLSNLNGFFKSQGRKMPIEFLQNLSNVYFDKVNSEDQLYMLSSFNYGNLKLAKSALLLATEYSATLEKSVNRNLIPEKSNGMVYKRFLDPSLPWYLSGVENFVYRLKNPKERLSTQLLSDSISPETLFDEIATIQQEVDLSQEKVQYNFIKGASPEVETETENTDETNKIEEIEKMGEIEEIEEIDEAVEVTNSKSKIGVDLLLDRLNLDDVYNSLVPSKKSIGDNWLPRIVNVTFGKVLFQEKSADSNSFFFSSFPEANKKLSKLSLFDKSATLFGTVGGIKSHFQVSLQVKLLPDGYDNFNNFKELPNIEIWFGVNKGVVDIETCDIFVNEIEKNVYVPIPEAKIDLKFQASYNSMLIDTASDNRLDFSQKQESLFKFISKLPRRLLNISEEDSISRLTNAMENHKIDIQLEGHKSPVPYLITTVNKKRSIELDYDGSLVIYEIVSNGETDRREISLIADKLSTGENLNKKQDKEEFENFSKKAFEFLKFLDS